MTLTVDLGHKALKQTNKQTNKQNKQNNTRNQNEGESIDSYLTEPRILSKPSKFEDLTDSHIKDRLVRGVITDPV